MPSAEVLVVGAGPVGLAAALRLARAGVETILLEREREPVRDFRASTFHPPTLEMLDELDLATPLIALGLPSPTWQIRIHETGEKAEFDLAAIAKDTRYPFRLQCEQSNLTRLAAEEALNTPSLDCRFGAAFLSFEQDDNEVRVRVNANSGEQMLSSRYLVAADGARSRVREVLGAGFEGETYPETTILATTGRKFEDVLPGLSNVNYVWCDWGTFSLLRLPNLWRCSLYPDDNESVEQALAPAAIETKLQRIAASERRYDVLESRAYRVHRRLIDSYRHGRVFFAGDAAHLTSPSGGMGMNGGVHDAFSLADKLTAVIRRGADPTHLDLYEAQRRPIAAEEILAQAGANRARMQRRDPEWRAQEIKRMQAIVADPAARREHLLRSSMIAGLRRAAAMP